MPHSHEIRIYCEILNSFKRLDRQGVPVEVMLLNQFGVHGVLCRVEATGRVQFYRTFHSLELATIYLDTRNPNKQLGA